MRQGTAALHTVAKGRRASANMVIPNMVTQWPKGDEPADAVEAPVTATQLAPSKPEVGQHREHRPQEEGDRWEDRLWGNGAVMSTCMQGDRCTLGGPSLARSARRRSRRELRRSRRELRPSVG
jgi:hypothetical protein